jgi:hypothetical protein
MRYESKPTLKLVLILGLLAASTVACSNKSSDERVGTFKESDPDGEAPSYQIRMLAPQFESAPTSADGSPNPVVRISDLGLKTVSVKIDYDLAEPEQKRLTVKTDTTTIAFNFQSGFRGSDDFEVEDSTGTYSVRGRCLGDLCESARLQYQRKGDSQSTLVRYVRTTEYLQAEQLEGLSTSRANNMILREAVEYGFPIVRHSARVDEHRDLDLLVVERPPVVDDEEVQGFELESQGSTVHTVVKPTIAPRPSTTPRTGLAPRPAVSPAQRPDRVVAPSPREDGPTPTVDLAIAATSHRLLLTRNPFAAYNVEPPARLFATGTVVRSPVQISRTSFNIVPVSEQEGFEPAFRITTLAEAMVSQRVRIYRNACNIFVRAVMALAGYLNAPWPTANNFENMFRSRADNLYTWERYDLANRSYSESNKLLLENHLHHILEEHAVVFQLERSGRRHGHVGFVTKEEGQYYFYDAALDRRPSTRRQITLEWLLQSFDGGTVRIHSFPNLLRMTPALTRST